MWLTRKVTPVQSSDWAGRTFLGECLALICKRNKEISFEAVEICLDRRSELPIDMEESPYYLIAFILLWLRDQCNSVKEKMKYNWLVLGLESQFFMSEKQKSPC